MRDELCQAFSTVPLRDAADGKLNVYISAGWQRDFCRERRLKAIIEVGGRVYYFPCLTVVTGDAPRAIIRYFSVIRRALIRRDATSNIPLTR